MTYQAKLVLDSLRTVLPDTTLAYPLHIPSFEGNEWEYVKECLDTGWVSSVGRYVDKFEKLVAEFTGAKRAVAVVNGTAALHISLLLAGVKVGDEVIIPSLSFIATANAVHYCGAVPHFVDVEEATLGMSPDILEYILRNETYKKDGSLYNKQTSRRISAVVPMHTFGHCCSIERIQEICAMYGVALVEDAAESLGSYVGSLHTGNFGLLSALSFNGNKTITTGGGGVVLTNNEHLADQAKHITTTAKIPHAWEYRHDQIGFNYRLPNINAALGVAQMEMLPAFLKRKRTLANQYAQSFDNHSIVKFIGEPYGSTSNYWLNAIRLHDDEIGVRDEVLTITNQAGIMTRPIWSLLHTMPMYADAQRSDMSTSISLERTIINIPSSPSIIPQ